MRSDGSIILRLLAVAIMGVVASALLVVAAVVWLSSYFGSVVIPCLMLALLLLLIAFIIYRVGLRSALREWAERTEVIYEVMSLLREGYTFVARLLALRRG